MQFTTTAAFIAALATQGALANSCVRQENAAYTYIVKGDGVTDIPGICGGLWDNLKRFSACAASEASCDDVNGQLQWTFNTGGGCDGGMVESSWWEATKNTWGGIDCP